jgi:peptidoglycan hydrolase CwlO-like protein
MSLDDKHEKGKHEKVSAERKQLDGMTELKHETDGFSPDTAGFKLLTNCILSVVIAMVATFVTMKIGMGYHDDKIQELFEQCNTLQNKVNSITESVTTISSAVAAVQDELKTERETSTYLSNGLATAQRDVETMKKELHIMVPPHGTDTNALPAKKKTFVDTLETLIADGAPFVNHVKANATNIKTDQYKSWKELAKFANERTRSVAELKNDFGVAGQKVFSIEVTESFWEKQKRVIKETIKSAIKIGKSDGDEKLDDKALFEKAGKQLADGDTAGACAILCRISAEGDGLKALISDMEKRVELDKAFAAFKKEVIEDETGEVELHAN